MEDAIKAAAQHCIENSILKEFLLKNETEVVAMLFGVYDEEMEKQVIREEERENWSKGQKRRKSQSCSKNG